MKTILFFVISLFCLNIYGQNTTRNANPVPSPLSKNQQIVLPLIDPINFFMEEMVGPCVSISNLLINYTGDKKSSNSPSQIGLWDDPNNTLGINYGIILSTGDVFNAIGTANYFASSSLNGPGDSLLSDLSGYPTHDAVTIEFDFIPLADSIVPFEFIFASEEYPEWVGTQFNDIFGFFIEGPGYNGLTNIANVPGTLMPISINNVNHQFNTAYYIDNANGTFWVYDGYTVKFTLHVPVIANEQYHFKFALADASDQYFDSAVILAAGSFMGQIDSIIPSFSYIIDNNTVYFQNTTTGGTSYLWDFGDGTTSTEENPVHTYSDLGIYQVKLKALNHCYEKEIIVTISLYPQSNTNHFHNELIQISELSKGLYKIYGNIHYPVAVYSINGQIIKTYNPTNDNSIIVDLQSYAEGIYILKSGATIIKLSR